MEELSEGGPCLKVEHLKELGVNAVELLPVFEFDEMVGSSAG